MDLTKFFPEVLNENQSRVWQDLDFISDMGFYLGGGTALALQLGHRTSLDFDFYNPAKFNNKQLIQAFQKRYSRIETNSDQPENTWHGKVVEVEVSAFLYQYDLIGKLVELSGVKIASLEDLAAMKVAAVIQRARQRDFVDIYYLSKNIGMDKIIASAEKKYPWYQENRGVVLTSLVYFLEADNDTEAGRIKVFDKKVTWQVVKSQITQDLKKFPVSEE